VITVEYNYYYYSISRIVEDMSTLKFYHSPVSPPSRFVNAILTLGNIPHELIIVDLLKQENKTEEYGKINPNKTVPALVDGDVKLWESHAIGKYLCDKVRHSSKKLILYKCNFAVCQQGPIALVSP